MKYQYMLITISLLVESSQANDLTNPCDHASTCAACLEADGQCYWCVDKDYTSGTNSRKPRCNLRSNLNDCRNIQIADGNVESILGANLNSKVQVTPQKVKLTLRPGQTQSFTLSVKPAKNYPLRLYYLMDMSNSMEKYLQQVRTLTTRLANEIKNFTTDYKFAFGMFVDKTVAPFIQLGMEIPCRNCAPTFGYKHVFDFNTDAKLFQDAVGKQKISGNQDTPEGGFDALMQVAACGDKIGWDPIGHSRRIVIFITDASPHIAGDGKVGGITTPHDGKCHLSTAGQYLMYSKSNDMDYPSISLLKETMKENKVVPIILVTDDVKPLYEKIALEWKDIGAGVGLLERDSSNIVDSVRDTYKKISTTVRLDDDSLGNIVVKYKVIRGCPKATPTVENECTEVGINQQVDFRVSFTVTSCPKKWKAGEKITITVPGFGHVQIEAKMICECGDCMKSGTTSSSLCSGKGSFKCGICHCDQGRLGKQCECDIKYIADTSLCIMPNSTYPEICSGFGTCVCGICECNIPADKSMVISGTYCQCNNFACNRYQGQICGGVKRGICKCGKCVCKEGFLGEHCGLRNCAVGMKNCLKHGVECSGNGKCDCDQCKCKTGYHGAYCEKNIYATNDHTGVAPPICRGANYIVCEHCYLQVSNRQEVRYNLEIDTNGNTRACARHVIILPTDLPIMEVISIIGGIVVIALLLPLIWKMMVTIYDRRAFSQYEKDRKEPDTVYWTPLQDKDTSGDTAVYMTAQEAINPNADEDDYLIAQDNNMSNEDTKVYMTAQDAINPNADADDYLIAQDNMSNEDTKVYMPAQDAINPNADTDDYVISEDANRLNEDTEDYVITEDANRLNEDAKIYMPAKDAINPNADTDDYVITEDANRLNEDTKLYMPAKDAINPNADTDVREPTNVAGAGPVYAKVNYDEMTSLKENESGPVYQAVDYSKMTRVKNYENGPFLFETEAL